MQNQKYAIAGIALGLVTVAASLGLTYWHLHKQLQTERERVLSLEVEKENLMQELYSNKENDEQQIHVISEELDAVYASLEESKKKASFHNENYYQCRVERERQEEEIRNLKNTNSILGEEVALLVNEKTLLSDCINDFEQTVDAIRERRLPWEETFNLMSSLFTRGGSCKETQNL